MDDKGHQLTIADASHPCLSPDTAARHNSLGGWYLLHTCSIKLSTSSNKRFVDWLVKTGILLVGANPSQYMMAYANTA